MLKIAISNKNLWLAMIAFVDELEQIVRCLYSY